MSNIDLNNVKTEHTQNPGTAPMQSLPVVEQLICPHRGAVAKLAMLRNTPLQCQARESNQYGHPPMLGLLGGLLPLPGGRALQGQRGGVSLDAEMWRSKAPHAGEDEGGSRSLQHRTHLVPRIEKFYKEVVCFDLLLQCPLRSIMELSPPNKIVLNSSSKRVVQDKKELIVGLSACLMISGQRCQTIWARKSVAGFKLREGSVIGCKVTLRGSSMYAFVDKLINLVLPRARPSLINQAIDPAGAYNIGVSDPFLFVELEHHYDLFQSLQGFDIALVMSSREKSLVPLLWSGLQLLTE
jgi:large subunit ribosomal protein L5